MRSKRRAIWQRERNHAVADRPAQIENIGDTGVKIVIVVLYFGTQEHVRYARDSVFKRKILRAALECCAYDLLCHLEHHECVGKQVRRRYTAHCHRRGKADWLVSKAGAGKVSVCGVELHQIEKVGYAAAVQRGVELPLWRYALAELAHRAVEPALNFTLEWQERVVRLRSALLTRREHCR